MNLPHVFHQVFRFGVVGGIATATHVVAFLSLVGVLQSKPIWANFIAWATAVSVSFVGHYYWTFRRIACRSMASTIPRFVLVSLSGLGLNTLVVVVVVQLAHAPYTIAALLMATVVPSAIFVLSKYWAFS